HRHLAVLGVVRPRAAAGGRYERGVQAGRELPDLRLDALSQMSVSLADLRRYAVDRSLFPPTTLKRAVARLGFVQADPIRAPARAQDLTLRHRVTGYWVGDFER